jgi:flavin reductase (DIM6/NTAB) family NADH-FMN oxidoreductase RutF
MRVHEAERDAVRRAMGMFAAGVTIITTRDHDLAPVGMTATAFTAVSHDPPSLLVCLNRDNRTRAHMEDSGRFGVNLLRSDATAESDHCATQGANKVLPADWLHSGRGWESPSLRAAIAFFDCTVDEVIEVGTHVVVIGAIQSVGLPAVRDASEPLMHYRGRYRRLAAPTSFAPALPLPVVLEELLS